MTKAVLGWWWWRKYTHYGVIELTINILLFKRHLSINLSCLSVCLSISFEFNHLISRRGRQRCGVSHDPDKRCRCFHSHRRRTKAAQKNMRSSTVRVVGPQLTSPGLPRGHRGALSDACMRRSFMGIGQHSACAALLRHCVCGRVYNTRTVYVVESRRTTCVVSTQEKA